MVVHLVSPVDVSVVVLVDSIDIGLVGVVLLVGGYAVSHAQL